LSKGLEQAGIFFDIARLRVLLITNDKDYDRKKKNGQIFFVFATLIIFLFQILIAYYLIDRPDFIEYLQESDAEKA
jgi:hypothetical protein